MKLKKMKMRKTFNSFEDETRELIDTIDRVRDKTFNSFEDETREDKVTYTCAFK